MRSDYGWVLTVLRIMDEDVVVIKLFGEAALVTQGTGGLEPNVQATSIFFRSNFAVVSNETSNLRHDEGEPS